MGDIEVAIEISGFTPPGTSLDMRVTASDQDFDRPLMGQRQTRAERQEVMERLLGRAFRHVCDIYGIDPEKAVMK